MNRPNAFTHSFASTYRIRILLGTLIALVAADGLVSRFLMTNRFGLEWNPFLQNWGVEEKFLVINAVGALLAALALWNIWKRCPKLSLVASSGFVALYTVIVFWNLFMFFIIQV